MLLTYLAAIAQKARSLKLPLLVVAVSALLALLFTVVTRPDAPSEPPAAGSVQMQLLQDEHTLVADYTRARIEADRTVADRDRAELRTSMVADAGEPAAVLPPIKPARVSRVAAVAPLPPPKNVTLGPPLPLQAAVATAAPPRQTPVMQRARGVVETVQRIPQWVGTGVRQAADWAMTGPVQTIARLPERRFL